MKLHIYTGQYLIIKLDAGVFYASLTDRSVLMFAVVDNYVHRLVASKTDGKMVQYECEGDTCHAEKIDALQLEVRSSCSCVSSAR